APCLDHGPLSDRRPRVLPMLLGRAAEERRIREAVGGAGACTVVHGEAGVGKTTLVRTVLAEVPHREGGALATLRWLPFLALRRAFADLPDATWSGDPEHVGSVLSAALGREPLLLEDLHWADPDTLRVVDLLLGRHRLVAT